jgi:hypothetical protein
MSLFDFPRINIKGTVSLNPGTANNDDYAASAFIPQSWGPPYAGQTLGLIDSKLVQPRTFGMNDADFVAWVQQAQTFDGPNGSQQIMPSEWNYYGDMSSTVSAGDAAVIGVETGPGQHYTTADPSVPATALLGAALTWAGTITDVNSEGSPPATQFFLDSLTLTSGATVALQGPASKAACQWINFYRNVNLTADGGAGGYIYHVVRRDQCASFDLPGFEDPSIVGLVFRYYLYRVIQGVTDNDGLAALYAQQQQNPATLQFVATIAPLYGDEEITTGPVGRLLIAPPPTIATPTSNNNGKGTIALAPAVLRQQGLLLSGEFVGTFPDNDQPAAGTNDKFDFGPVALVADGNGTSATIGAIDYADTAAGDARGWLFDFDLSENPAAQQVLTDPAATFRLVSPQYAAVLAETRYYVVSNQQALYAEQNGPGDSFRNQGTCEPATVEVYEYGRPLAAADCPPITVWSYSTVPLQTPGALVKVMAIQPGDPIAVDTSLSGNFLFTFTVGDDAPPPSTYNDFLNPPFTTITNLPGMSLRILPNDHDFSQYYVDPTAPEPIGNAQLTFDVVFTNVLRTYYLLYPIMNLVIPLNDETKLAASAARILAATDPQYWMTQYFMPRTRDMSESRRTLLQAWCRKVKT